MRSARPVLLTEKAGSKESPVWYRQPKKGGKPQEAQNCQKKMSLLGKSRGITIQDTQTLVSYRHVHGGFAVGCTYEGNIKRKEFSPSLIKSKTNGDLLRKFLEQTKPAQSCKQSSIQLFSWDQPDLSHFLFMPLETISRSFQDISNIVRVLSNWTFVENQSLSLEVLFCWQPMCEIFYFLSSGSISDCSSFTIL